MAHDKQLREDMEQAERMKALQMLQEQMDAMYSHNMRALQQLSPTLFARFRHHQPSKYGLSLSPEGYLDIVDLKSRRSIYNTDPAEISLQQVDQFDTSPNRIVCDLRRSPVINPKYFSPQMLNRMLNQMGKVFVDEEIQKTYELNSPIGCLIVTGTGIGHHLSHLYDRHSISNLIIYEAEPDLFHCSLHTFNWATLITEFLGQKKGIEVYVGNSPADVVSALTELNKTIPLFQLTKLFYFRHLPSASEAEFIERLKAAHTHIVVNGGFFDDELVGLAHTITNLHNNCKIFDPSNAPISVPAIIVGNGPSLDELIPFLKENANKAVIFCCGTALAPLYRLGIKPDFHIEMERTAFNEQWIAKAAPGEFRQDITLLALNTCPPNVAQQFGDCILAKKHNDIAEQLIDQYCKGASPITLANCNPTVTNAAVSFAIHLGFKKLFLVGVDLGMPLNDDKHHSQYSLYADISKKNENAYKGLEKQDGQLIVTGNRGGKVRTTKNFNNSRINIESSLRHHPTVECFNLNDGAFIEGSTPAFAADVSLSKPIDKVLLINQLKKSNSLTPSALYDPQQTINTLLEPTIKNWGEYELPDIEDNATLKEIHDLFLARWHKLLRHKKTDFIHYHLFQGSLNAAFATIYSNCAEAGTDEQRTHMYKIGRRIFNNFFLHNEHQKLTVNPLACDDSVDGNIATLD